MRPVVLTLLALALSGCSNGQLSDSAEDGVRILQREGPAYWLTYSSSEIKKGDVDQAKVKEGIDSVLSELNKIVKNNDFKLSLGKFGGRLVADQQGKIHVFATGLSNDEENADDDRFLSEVVFATFGGKFRFPEIGDDLELTFEFSVGPDLGAG